MAGVATTIRGTGVRPSLDIVRVPQGILEIVLRVAVIVSISSRGYLTIRVHGSSQFILASATCRSDRNDQLSQIV